jgi:hypothetical protein
VHLLAVENGELATASGMRYRVLALDPFSQHMSLPVLRKIRDLVQDGAVVCGPRPIATPSLSDDPKEFRSIVDQLWGPSGSGNSVGKGKVYGNQTLGEVLAGLNVMPDFEYTKPNPDTQLLFVHRRLADADLYYVDNRNDRSEESETTFRIDGREAELWHADIGKIEPASYKATNGRTTVALHLAPWETVFVVFRHPSTAASRALPRVIENSIATIEGPWELSFQPDRGAPPKISLEKLAPWQESKDEGVKYFGGTGIYTKTLQAASDWFKPGGELWIDLGEVKNLAEVSVNGKPLGIVWKTPYRVDATSVLHPGANFVQIKVTNGWANRIIGDRQPNTTKTYTFTSPKFYKANAPLQPSGLLGPVQVIRAVHEAKSMK